MHSGLRQVTEFSSHTIPRHVNFADPILVKESHDQQKQRRLRKLFRVKPWADRLREGPRPPPHLSEIARIVISDSSTTLFIFDTDALTVILSRNKKYV